MSHFIIGQTNDKYDDFILLSNYDPAYEDMCKTFLHELTYLQHEDRKYHQTGLIIINYSKENLFILELNSEE